MPSKTEYRPPQNKNPKILSSDLIYHQKETSWDICIIICFVAIQGESHGMEGCYTQIQIQSCPPQ